MGRQQITDWMQTETQRWGKLVKEHNIQAN
jgi:hypothetical protein